MKRYYPVIRVVGVLVLGFALLSWSAALLLVQVAPQPRRFVPGVVGDLPDGFSWCLVGIRLRCLWLVSAVSRHPPTSCH
ncbi:MAG: hypothetical protein IPJ27_13055 [Candidatus Accumulibacter sp.]|uniref:Uncharacterized protein n=1 Tax=Candidatus Accumulibacter proximus TaxID=2954385 RepID=A0A935PYC6_9PROT|nr:hypothetical protein [Candidatus Accumulibacter proximus]